LRARGVEGAETRTSAQKGGGVFVANSGFAPGTARAALAAGEADAVAFGTLFIADPDLPRRIKLRARVGRQEAGDASVAVASKEKDGERVFSSSMRVAIKKRFRFIGSEQMPRLWEPRFLRALYLAFV